MRFPEYQDIHVLHVNRLPNRATLIPWAETDQALSGQRKASPFYMDLNGCWDFSFYVKDAEPMTNGLVIGSLDSNGKLVEIKGPAPVSTVEWLKEQVGKCMFSYQDIYELKQQWEPKLDSIQVFRRETVIRTKSRRWGIGVQAGYGIATDGLSPYIGLGLSYRLF